jgi:membrane-associated phospholipid phosphatase
MSKFGKAVKYYLLAYVLILIIALVPQIMMSQNELFLALNNIHIDFLDQIFYWLTFFGDGLTYAILIIIVLFYSYRFAMHGLLSFLLTAGIAQFLKKVVFSERMRPFAILGEDYSLYLPEGVIPLYNNSFPSGHTTTAFAMAMFLVLVIRKKMIWPALLVIALLAGYSRIYLTHHFPIDVWTGSIIGTAGTLLLYWWLDDKFVAKFSNRSLRNR